MDLWKCSWQLSLCSRLHRRAYVVLHVMGDRRITRHSLNPRTFGTVSGNSRHLTPAVQAVRVHTYSNLQLCAAPLQSLTSQPLVMLPSQLPKPALQAVMAQLPLLHVAEATLSKAVQLLPHRPQLFVSLEKSTCMHGKAQHLDILLCMLCTARVSRLMSRSQTHELILSRTLQPDLRH
jgi:hypothetical protein